VVKNKTFVVCFDLTHRHQFPDRGDPIGHSATLILRVRQKKTDVVERPKAFNHVGLLSNGLPGKSGPPFI
jgi:hypothetical protein